MEIAGAEDLGGAGDGGVEDHIVVRIARYDRRDE